MGLVFRIQGLGFKSGSHGLGYRLIAHRDLRRWLEGSGFEVLDPWLGS
jgi:hypothetical protein